MDPTASQVAITWSTAAINAFASLWTAAVANGWQIPTAVLPTFNFAVAAVTPIGNYYLPQGTDPLWDVDAPGAVPPLP